MRRCDNVVRGVVASLFLFVAASAASGFEPAGGKHGRKAGLSEDQRNQLRQLRSDLDQGNLTPQQFAAQVDGILGDRVAPPAGPIAGRGKMMRRGFARMADKLQLTDEQRTTARQNFQSMQHKVRIARLEARASIRQTLTADQRAQLDQLRAGHKGAAGGAKAALGHKGARAELADKLQLTDEQKTAIKSIRDKTRAAIKAIRQDARQQFHASLTPDQSQTLEQIKQKHQGRKAGPSSAGDRSN